VEKATKLDKEAKEMTKWVNEVVAPSLTELIRPRGWRVEFIHGRSFQVPKDAPFDNAGEVLSGIEIHLSPIPPRSTR
jgi:hypothetical protein